MYQPQKDAITRFLRSRAEVNKMSGVLANMIKEDRNVDAVLIPEKFFEHIADLSDKTGLTHASFKIGKEFVLCYPSEEKEKYMEIREEVLAGGKRLLYPDLSYSEMRSAIDMMEMISVNFHVNLQPNGKFEILGLNLEKEKMDQIISMVNAEKLSDIGMKVDAYRETVFAHAINQISYALASPTLVVMGSENGAAYLSLSSNGALITDAKGEQKLLSREINGFERKFTKAVLEDLKGDRAPIKIFFGEIANRLSENMFPITLSVALKELNLTKIPSIDKLENIPEEVKIQYPEAYAAVERATCFCSQKVAEVEKCRPKPEVMKEYANMHKKHIETAKTLQRENEKDLSR